MTAIKPPSVVVPLLLAALALGACGGSSGTSKSSYINRADAICAKADTQINGVPKPQLTGTQAHILKGLGVYVDRVLPVVHGVVGQLKGLSQPSADQAILRRYFAALDDAVTRLQNLSAAIRRGDVKAVQAEATALNNAQPDALARQYGFKRCGGTGGAASG